MEVKMKKSRKRKIVKSILCTIISLLIGFISTYALFFFSVDSYKYSGDKEAKSFSEIGYEGFDVSDSNSITRWGRQSQPTVQERSQIYTCLKIADYTELSLTRAFPLFWIAFTPQKYICDLYFDKTLKSDFLNSTVFSFNDSVFLLNYNNESEPNLISLTVYKVTNVDVKTIRDVGGVKDSDLKYVGTQYQYLYSDATQKDWYFNYVAILIAMSLVAFIIIKIIGFIKQKV